jgi:hypothetical protein
VNTNQKFSGNGSGVAIVVIIGLGIAALNWLFSADETETKPETTPTDAGTENHAVHSIAPTVSTPILPLPVPLKPENSTHTLFSMLVPYTKSVAQTTQSQPPGRKRRQITPEDMAIALQRGERAFSLKEAVAALQSFGFGKSAAYAALSPDGRFSAWLKFAADGKITWKN